MLKRLGLVVAGSLVGLALVEVGLQLVSLAARRQREVRLSTPPPDADEIRVLCVGESTTEGIGTDPWPRQLEELLNQARPRIPFRVLNRGLTSCNSAVIANQLPRWLDQDRPHAVVAMMGVNDRRNVLVFEAPSKGRRSPFERLRTYRLLRGWLRSAAAERAAPAEAPPVATPKPEPAESPNQLRLEALEERLAEYPTDRHGLAELAELYRRSANRERLVETLHRLVGVDPETAWLVELAELEWQVYSRLAVAEKLLRRAVRLDPASFEAHLALGHLLVVTESDQAEATLRRAVEVDRDRFEGYKALARYWIAVGRCGEREVALLRAGMAREPVGARVAVELAGLLGAAGRRQEEEQVLLEAVVLPSRDPHCFWSLAAHYRKRDDPERAAEVLERGIAAFPSAENLLRALGAVYFAQGRFEEALEVHVRQARLHHPDEEDPRALRVKAASLLLWDKMGTDVEQLPEQVRAFAAATGLEVDPGTAFTRRSYARVKELLDQRGVTLFAMQYPRVDLAQLEALLDFADDVVFVENQTRFERELSHRRWEELFTDRFAGRFGHLTPLGNRLVAESAAASILRSFADSVPADGATAGG